MQVRGNTPHLSNPFGCPQCEFHPFWVFWSILLEIGKTLWGVLKPDVCFFFLVFFLNQNSLLFSQRHSRPEGMTQCIFLHVLLCKCHVTATEIHIKMTRRPHWSSSASQQSYCQRCILPSSHWSHSHLKPTCASAPNCFPLCSCHQGRGVRERPAWSSIPNCLQ